MAFWFRISAKVCIDYDLRSIILMICLKCGADNPSKTNYCQKCGAFIKNLGIFDEPVYGHLNIVSEDGKKASSLGYAECVPCREIRQAGEGIISGDISLKDFQEVLSSYFDYLPERIESIQSLIATGEAQSVPDVLQMYEYMISSYNLMHEALNTFKDYLAEQNSNYIHQGLEILKKANDEMSKAKEIGQRLENL